MFQQENTIYSKQKQKYVQARTPLSRSRGLDFAPSIKVLALPRLASILYNTANYSSQLSSSTTLLAQRKSSDQASHAGSNSEISRGGRSRRLKVVVVLLEGVRT